MHAGLSQAFMLPWLSYSWRLKYFVLLFNHSQCYRKVWRLVKSPGTDSDLHHGVDVVRRWPRLETETSVLLFIWHQESRGHFQRPRPRHRALEPTDCFEATSSHYSEKLSNSFYIYIHISFDAYNCNYYWALNHSDSLSERCTAWFDYSISNYLSSINKPGSKFQVTMKSIFHKKRPAYKKRCSTQVSKWSRFITSTMQCI